jgi:hypothetical protein
MKVELRKNGGPKITADREGLHALRELLGAALEVGHGFQSDGTLPEVVVVDDKGKVMLPARPEKHLTERDFEKVMLDAQEKRLAERTAEDERFKRVQAALDRDTNLKRLYGGTDPTSGRKEPAQPGIEAERLDSGQE